MATLSDNTPNVATPADVAADAATEAAAFSASTATPARTRAPRRSTSAPARAAGTAKSGASSARTPASGKAASGRTASRKPASGKTASGKSATKTARSAPAAASASSTRSASKSRATTTSTQPKTVVGQVSDIASRVILVPVGASLFVRDDILMTVKDIADRYRTAAAGIERDLERYEKRGAAARNRLETQVRRQRTKLEHDLSARRRRVAAVVRQGNMPLDRVRTVRLDLDRSSKLVTDRVEKVISSAHGFIR